MNWTISVVFGRGPYLRLWRDISRIWNANGRSARNVLVAPSQETVHIVVNIFRRIWASTLLFTTWNLRSCGAARLCGVRYGRELLRTVLIICGVHTRCRYQSKRRIWPSIFQRGQSLKNNNQTCWCHVSPAWRLICYYSVASVRLYVTDTTSVMRLFGART